MIPAIQAVTLTMMATAIPVMMRVIRVIKIGGDSNSDSNGDGNSDSSDDYDRSHSRDASDEGKHSSHKAHQSSSSLYNNESTVSGGDTRAGYRDVMLFTAGIVLGLCIALGNVAFCWWFQTRSTKPNLMVMETVDVV
eukprot:TRINITY_DN98_c0_g1_i4.p1 TRINITY_DN98_c0_g1~~TRINITY_DN98_c0_g1_i4.p1  ORF type:complete len:137 (+),score=23.09 TRINITY_DN98_c0_g1_i4:111-521(+)